MTSRFGQDHHDDADSAKERSRALFDELAALDPADPRRSAVRSALVEVHAGLAYSIARRFSQRGQPDDDLQQVAMIGLLKSIDRFEPARGIAFSSFATPTIRGEIRRYFRDTAWAVHVPRGLRELAVAIPPAVEELTATLHRAPRPSEIAAALGTDVDRVVEALDAAEGYSAVALDAPSDQGFSVADTLGVHDDALDLIDERQALRPLLDALPERERSILVMRFFDEMSQSQIAARVNLSQMHVSRLLARTLSELHDQLARADTTTAAGDRPTSADRPAPRRARTRPDPTPG